jgi:predicted DNA-binding transcriptional regulator AlpA
MRQYACHQHDGGTVKTATKPHALLDALRKDRDLRSDAHLAEVLGYSRQHIYKMRIDGPVPDTFRVVVQRVYGWSLKKIDALAPPAIEGEKK